MRSSTLLKWTLILAVGATVALWIGAIGFGVFAMRPERFVGAAALFAGASLMALPCAIGRDQGRCRPLMLSGMAATAVSLLGWLWLLWTSGTLTGTTFDRGITVITPFTIWAGFCMVVAALIMRRFTSRAASVVFAATVAAAGAMGLVILSAVWFEDTLWRRGETLAKWLGALGVVTAFGMLVTLLMTRLRELEGGKEAAVEDVIRLDLTVTCPRCRDRQTMQTGGAHCRRCGLHIRVTVP